MPDPVHLQATLDYDGPQWFTEDPAEVRVRALDGQGDPLEGAAVIGLVRGGTTAVQEEVLTGPDGRASAVVEVQEEGTYEVEVAFSDGVHTGYVSAGTHVVRVQQDVTFGPVLGSVSATDTGQTTGEATVTTSSGNGTIYWVASRISSEPSKIQIQNGNRADGTPAADSGSITVQSGGQKQVSIAGLTPGVSYTTFFFQRDTQGRESSIVSATFTTSTAAQAKGELLYSRNTIATTIF